MLNIIPNTVVDAFARGEILQVLLFSVLFGSRPSRSERVSNRWSPFWISGRALFGIVGHRDAAGADWRLRRHGLHGGVATACGTLISLGQLMLAMYATACSSCSSCSAQLPRHRLQPRQVLEVHQRRDPDCARHVILGIGAAEIMEKLETDRLRKPMWGWWCDRLLVQPRWHVHLHDNGGVVCRAGQRGAPLFGEQLSLLGVLLLTSKGARQSPAAGSSRSPRRCRPFRTFPSRVGIAARCGPLHVRSALDHESHRQRGATMVIARWEGSLDLVRVRRILAHGVPELPRRDLDTVPRSA